MKCSTGKETIGWSIPNPGTAGRKSEDSQSGYVRSARHPVSPACRNCAELSEIVFWHQLEPSRGRRRLILLIVTASARSAWEAPVSISYPGSKADARLAAGMGRKRTLAAHQEERSLRNVKSSRTDRWKGDLVTSRWALIICYSDQIASSSGVKPLFCPFKCLF